ncbi:Hypothetical predicted protein [Olea europaea subsp. europaea]|uniref:Pentatricopeptide repeat-containing protein n=1 Tax=Olea europaea subsp. europaea TaxID=158383 RepID=A0A8S0RVI7_OLEEU|nr:Hypothetical predicted protein [Olea europaea subsp. europaea]
MDEMKRKEMLSCNEQPNKITYTVIIDGYCKLGRIKEAFELLSEMIGNGVDPDPVTYITLANVFCKEGKEMLIKIEWKLQHGIRCHSP